MMDTSEPAPTSTPQPAEHTTQSPGTPVGATTSETNQKPARSPLGWLKRLSRKQAILLAVAAVLILAGIGGSAWAIIYYRSANPAPSKTATTTKPDAGGALKATKNIDGITFLASAKKLDSLHLFTNYNSYFGTSCTDDKCTNSTPSVTDDDVTYYQVGTGKDGQKLVDVQVADNGPMGPYTDNFLIVQNVTEKYTLLAIPSGVQEPRAIDDLKSTLASSVTVDTDSDIAELNFPAHVTVVGAGDRHVTFDGPLSYASLRFNPDGLSKLTVDNGKTYPSSLFGTSGTYAAYKINLSTSADYQMTAWFVGYNNMYSMQYGIADSFSQPDNAASKSIAWTSGQHNKSEYSAGSMAIVGCGSFGSYVAMPAGTTTDSLTKIGTTPSGQVVYALPASSPVLQMYYSRSSVSFQSQDNDKALTIDQFQDEHGVVVVQNAAGEYAVYGRADFTQGGGCGEPVIYLYPKTPTHIDVSVGAKVVKSDPFYPSATGWRDVLAQPNGQLTYQGKAYSSLLWEGYGHGQYPAITSGSIVPGDQAATTIRAQMKTLGFLPNEINDFMAFWGPKLPRTPYVRLTWFGTSEVQALAPLTVWPRPNTVLRAFLDFEGLQEPVKLPVQHLAAEPRKGFTVVEWGGLLRDGIN